mmetsp:Transcript_42671/g.93485  ORF Transcript_42671/g.93485 Transcript_42671/m.93485 type:complete len:82 (+) Transcript_42671:444-689(+)
MSCLLAATHGVQTCSNDVLGLTPLNEIVLHSEMEQAICGLLVMIRKPQRSSKLGDMSLAIGKCNLARLSVKSKANIASRSG